LRGSILAHPAVNVARLLRQIDLVCVHEFAAFWKIAGRKSEEICSAKH
jgi:hypothetical protein